MHFSEFFLSILELQLIGQQGLPSEADVNNPTEAAPLENQNTPLPTTPHMTPTAAHPTQTPTVKASPTLVNEQAGTAGHVGPINSISNHAGHMTDRTQDKDPMKITPDMANKILHMIQEKGNEFEISHKAAAQKMQKNISADTPKAGPANGSIVAEKLPSGPTQPQAPALRNASAQISPMPFHPTAAAVVPVASKPFQDALVSNKTTAVNSIPQNKEPSNPVPQNKQTSNSVPQISQPPSAASQNSVPGNAAPVPTTKATSETTPLKNNASNTVTTQPPIGAPQKSPTQPVAAAPQQVIQAPSQQSSNAPTQVKPVAASELKKLPSVGTEQQQPHAAASQFLSPPKGTGADSTSDHLPKQQPNPPAQQEHHAPPQPQQHPPVQQPDAKARPSQQPTTHSAQPTHGAPTQGRNKAAPQLLTATRPENIHHVVRPTRFSLKTTPFEFFKDHQAAPAQQSHPSTKNSEQM